MKISIKSKNLELTGAMKEFVEEKIGVLAKFIKSFEVKEERLIEVEVSRPSKHHHHGQVFYAEANLQLPKKLLRAEDTNYDARVAVTNVREKMKREIEKYKTSLEK